MTIQRTEADRFTTDWQEWHRDHEERRADPHGFLAVTGLHFLAEEPRRVPDAPGLWSTGPGGPVVELGDGEELVVDGSPVHGTYAFGVLAERTGVTAVYTADPDPYSRRADDDPELQERGVYRTSYEGTTLREHLALPPVQSTSTSG